MTLRQEIELKLAEIGLVLSEDEIVKLVEDTQKNIAEFDAKFGPYLKNVAHNARKLMDGAAKAV